MLYTIEHRIYFSPGAKKSDSHTSAGLVGLTLTCKWAGSFANHGVEPRASEPSVHAPL